MVIFEKEAMNAAEIWYYFMLWVTSGAMSVPDSLIKEATRAGISTPLGQHPAIYTHHTCVHTHTHTLVDRASALAGVWLANKRPLIILLERRLTNGITTFMITNQLMNTSTS